tara:strand:- start:7476 stop:7991 length:516 start_codon:yes stop_codon:yes gene_type:complete
MKLSKPKVFKGIFNHHIDERGFLNAMNLKDLLAIPNLNSFSPKYQLMSLSTKKNIFRGLHYQSYPNLQSKLVIIHSGEITDFVVPFEHPLESKVKIFDLKAGDILLVPNSYAHGFITRSDSVNIQYLLDHEYSSESYSGINAIDYVTKHSDGTKLIVSQKDKDYKKILLKD